MRKNGIITIFVLIAVMMVLTACSGIDVSKIAGKWHVETINGKSAREFAEENGYIEAAVQKVVTVSEDEVSIACIIGDTYTESKGKTVVRSNGVEAEIDGILFGFTYDEEADTLSYILEADGSQYAYIYSRGEYDFSEVNFKYPGDTDDATGAEAADDATGAEVADDATGAEAADDATDAVEDDAE